MRSLPRELQPWAEPLHLLDPIVHQGIGGWLSPLRELLGPLPTASRAPVGDFDGFAGFTRRGPYERLLLSEWALALEAPDEFSRRAAMQELLFLAPAYRAPRADRLSIALLDCGPLQLGAPRLAQLAALVVLARRAEEDGATFRFGLLQDRDCRLHPMQRDALATWLKGRSRMPGQELVAAWKDALREQGQRDVWVVGAPSLESIARALDGGLLAIEEPLEPGAEVLRVSARRGDRSLMHADLLLPPSATGVQILRAPLASQRRVIRSSPATDGGVLGRLSSCGRRLFLPQLDGGIHAVFVPPRPTSQPGKPKRILPQRASRLVAADLRTQHVLALAVSDDDEIVLRGSGYGPNLRPGPARSISTVHRTGLRIDSSMHLFADARLGQSATCELFVHRAGATHFDAHLLDLSGQLWHIELLDGSEPSLRCVDRAAHVVTPLGQGEIAWASESTGRVEATCSVGDAVLTTPLDAATAKQVVFGPGGQRDGRFVARFGVPVGASIEVYNFGAKAFQLLPHPSGELIGLRKLGIEEIPTSIWLDDERRHAYCGSSVASGPLFTSSDPIVEIRYAPSCGRIVYRTETGWRGVYCFEANATVLKQAPTEARS